MTGPISAVGYVSGLSLVDEVLGKPKKDEEEKVDFVELMFQALDDINQETQNKDLPLDDNPTSNGKYGPPANIEFEEFNYQLEKSGMNFAKDLLSTINAKGSYSNLFKQAQSGFSQVI